MLFSLCWIVVIEGPGGDYYRLLPSGDYVVEVCARPIYECVTKSVTVRNSPHQLAQIVNFVLPMAVTQVCII